MRLKNRIALVTGASRGIGREIALVFAYEGACVHTHSTAYNGKTSVTPGPHARRNEIHSLGIFGGAMHISIPLVPVVKVEDGNCIYDV